MFKDSIDFVFVGGGGGDEEDLEFVNKFDILQIKMKKKNRLKLKF